MTNFEPRVQSCQPLVTRPVIGIEAFKPPPMQFSMVQMAMRPPNVLGIIGLPPLPSMAHMPMFQLSAGYMGKGQAWGNLSHQFIGHHQSMNVGQITQMSLYMHPQNVIVP